MDVSFFRELEEKIIEHKSASFYWYLAIYVFVIGGAGIWIPFIKNFPNGMQNLADNLITFSIAIIGPSFYSLSLSFLEFKNKPSLMLFQATLLIVDIILLLLFYQNCPLIPGFILLIEAVLLWKIVNNDNRKLDDHDFNQDVENKVKTLSKDWR